MTDGYLNQYIRDRMQELNVAAYHWEPAVVSVSANEYRAIGAYNEYYILVARTLPEGTLIQGDNHYVIALDFANLTFARLHEFTGNLSIEPTANANIEFIRVIIEI